MSKMRRRISLAGSYMAYYGFLGAVACGMSKRLQLDGWSAVAVLAAAFTMGALIQYKSITFLGPED